MKEEIEHNNELLPDDDWNYPTTEPPKKKNIFKKIFTGVGYGGVFVGSGLLYLIFSILHFLFYASAGLAMVGLAISLFRESSIVWGLVVLLIGTPLAIGIAQAIFFPILLLSIIAGIVWGISRLFGFHFSFEQSIGGVWEGLKWLVMLGMIIFGSINFYEAVKDKNIKGFFRENWFGILFFGFLFWLFFL